MYMGVSQSLSYDTMVIDFTLNEPNGLINYGELFFQVYGAQFNRVVGNIINHGLMDLKSDIGYIKGNVTNLSGAELYLINLCITGELQNFSGGMIEIERVVNVDGDVGNAGFIEVIPGSELMVDSAFHNIGQIQMSGGFCGSYDLFHNDVNGVIKGFGVILAEQVLQNEGQIYAYGGSIAISSEGGVINEGILGNNPSSSLHIKSAEDMNNHGTIEVNAGGGVAFDCDLNNEPNATIYFNGGTLAAGTITQKDGAILEGFGGITGDVTIEDNGIIKLTGPTNIVGNVEIGTDATLEISDGTTLVTGHTTNNGTIHMKGGRIIPQGGFTNNGNVIWEPGVYNNIADFNLDGEVNLQDFADFADTWLWQAQL